MTDETKRKFFGIAAIVMAVIIGISYIYIFFINKSALDKEAESAAASQESSANGGIETVRSFANIDSPVNYELNPELEEELDPVRFDNAFVKFLTENKYIFVGSDADDVSKVVTVKDEGGCEIDFEEHTLQFTLKLLLTDTPYIQCVVYSDGTYDFISEEFGDGSGSDDADIQDE